MKPKGLGDSFPTREAGARPILDLGPEPTSVRRWWASIWAHRSVIWALSRKDFHVRYKRASFGVAWAVALPLMQAAVLTIVFSRFIRVEAGLKYAPFVMSGVLPWSYLASTMVPSATSIVDSAGLTAKVWFPRGLLPIVPCLSGVVGLGVSMVALVTAAPLLGAPIRVDVLLLIPACVFLVFFAICIGLVLSALHVYFRDVRFITTASLLILIYATPIVYPKSLVGELGQWLDFNPFTGVIELFRSAILGTAPSPRALLVSLLTAIALLAVGTEVQRRHDRLYADRL